MPEVTDNHQQAELAKRIKSARLTCRLSQVVLARQIGVSDKSISAYESNRVSPPLKVLEKIAEQTDQTLTFFLEDSIDSAILAKLKEVERQFKEIKFLLEGMKK